MFDPGANMATQQPPTTDDESVEGIIWRVGTTLSARYRAKLTSRLSELQNAVQEEELASRGITVRSLQHFIELLKAYPVLRCPAVSVTPDEIFTPPGNQAPTEFSVFISCPTAKSVLLSFVLTTNTLVKPFGYREQQL
jgi:hypothetical protein